MSVGLGAPERRRVQELLQRSAQLGWLGPGALSAHIDHALAVAAAVREVADVSRGVLDLGSGGGVPGIVVAVALAPAPVTMLDGAARRCSFLRAAAGELADIASVEVAEGRAEDLARRAGLCGRFGAVTARSFGRPAVTAECATGFLPIGGWLVVSEPPETAETALRWDRIGLAKLGFGEVRQTAALGTRLALIPKEAAGAGRYPRRAGVPAKRALW